MIFTHHFVCVDAATQPLANQRAHVLGIDPDFNPDDPYSRGTFSIALNPLGDASAATHYCAMGRMPDTAYAAIKAAGQSNMLPSRWWSLNDDSGPDLGRCFASWDGSHLGEIMTFPDCLAACGLKRRVVPLNLPT